MLVSDRWEIREWHIYAVYETRETTLRIPDMKPVGHDLTIEGDKSLLDLEALIRRRFNIPGWDKVSVSMADGKVFWTEHRII
jgi:hypothetical protein